MNSINWKLLFPDIGKMIDIFINNPDHFLNNWWATFSVSLIASIIALILGLIISVTANKIKFVNYLFMPIVAISQSFPLQAIAPLILIVMGVGFQTKTFIAFLIAFFPIYNSCLNAIKTTPENYLNYARVNNSSYLKEVFYIRIPHALPAIVSSAKVGFTLAVLGSVVAEFIQPDKGLGNLILIAQSSYNIEVIYICLILLIAQGLFFYLSLTYLEKYLIKKGGF